jgi:hypothetical protein
MHRVRNTKAEVKSLRLRVLGGVRRVVPSVGVGSRFGGDFAHGSEVTASRSLPRRAAQHAWHVRAGCPSFGGHRTVWFGSEERCAPVYLTAISSLRRSSKTNDQQPGVVSVAPRSCNSLALRMRAAPGRSGRAGTGFARATTAGAFGHSINETVVVRGGARYSTAAPNTSFKRTHNGGPGLLASAKPAAPLCAA